MPFDLVIAGAGGMGQEIADLVQSIGRWNLLGFVDDSAPLAGRELLGVPILGGISWLAGHSPAVCVAIGSPSTRRRVCERLGTGGDFETPALVHPKAHFGYECEVGDGSMVLAGSVLTVDVKAGRFALINAGATVSHNCRLNDYATIAPGAHVAGNVHIGEGAEIGIGASVVQGVVIGEWSVVGAGAVVTKDVDANTTVVGCPARSIAQRDPGWHV